MCWFFKPPTSPQSRSRKAKRDANRGAAEPASTAHKVVVAVNDEIFLTPPPCLAGAQRHLVHSRVEVCSLKQQLQAMGAPEPRSRTSRITGLAQTLYVAESRLSPSQAAEHQDAASGTLLLPLGGVGPASRGTVPACFRACSILCHGSEAECRGRRGCQAPSKTH